MEDLEQELQREKEIARQLQAEHIQLLKKLAQCTKILEHITDPQNVLSPRSLLSLGVSASVSDVNSVLSPASRHCLRSFE